METPRSSLNTYSKRRKESSENSPTNCSPRTPLSDASNTASNITSSAEQNKFKKYNDKTWVFKFRCGEEDSQDFFNDLDHLKEAYNLSDTDALEAALAFFDSGSDGLET